MQQYGDILSHVFDKTGDKFIFVMDEWDAVFHMSLLQSGTEKIFFLFFSEAFTERKKVKCRTGI